MLAQDLAGEVGGKGVKEEGEKRERGKQPQGWRKILYACALKHKVCGQLLKDFSSGVKIILRVRGEKSRVLYDYASVSQFYWVTARDRQTLSAELSLFPPQTLQINQDLLAHFFLHTRIQWSLIPTFVFYHFPSRTSPGSVLLHSQQGEVSVDCPLLPWFETELDESRCQGHGAAFAQPRLSKGWKDSSPWNTSWPAPPFCMWWNRLRRNRHGGRGRAAVRKIGVRATLSESAFHWYQTLPHSHTE